MPSSVIASTMAKYGDYDVVKTPCESHLLIEASASQLKLNNLS